MPFAMVVQFVLHRLVTEFEALSVKDLCAGRSLC